MRSRSFRWFWVWLCYLLWAAQPAFSYASVPDFKRPHSNLFKLSATVATVEAPLTACEQLGYEDGAFERDCLSPASASLSSSFEDILAVRSSYTEEVTAYQETLEREGRLHTDLDTSERNQIMTESGKSDHATKSYGEYVKLLCETGLPGVMAPFWEKHRRPWKGELVKREKEVAAITHQCELSSSYGDHGAGLQLRLWIQSVKMRGKPIEFYNSLNLIGVMDSDARFVAFEVISYKGMTEDDVVTVGVLPVPDYSENSYLRIWSQWGFFLRNANEFAGDGKRKKINCDDWWKLWEEWEEESEEEVCLDKWEEREREAIMAMPQIDRAHRDRVRKFYTYLAVQGLILLNNANDVFSYNVRAMRAHYRNPHFNHIAELRLLCAGIRGRSDNWGSKVEMTTSATNTALCISKRDENSYEKKFWIRTASRERSIYFVGEWNPDLDQFEPYDMIYMRDSQITSGLVGALPPLTDREREELVTRKQVDELESEIARIAVEKKKLEKECQKLRAQNNPKQPIERLWERASRLHRESE